MRKKNKLQVQVYNVFEAANIYVAHYIKIYLETINFCGHHCEGPYHGSQGERS